MKNLVILIPFLVLASLIGIFYLDFPDYAAEHWSVKDVEFYSNTIKISHDNADSTEVYTVHPSDALMDYLEDYKPGDYISWGSDSADPESALASLEKAIRKQN